MRPVISWNTHKTATGYEWRVYSVAYQQRLAQRWMAYLKRVA